MVFLTLDHWHPLLSVWYMLNKHNQLAATFLMRLREKDDLSQIYTIIYTPKNKGAFSCSFIIELFKLVCVFIFNWSTAKDN